MGRKYERKSERGSDSESLKEAAQAVRKGEMSVRKAALSHSVPRTTLQRYLSTSEEELQSSSYKNCKTANLVFTEQMETMLAQHIRDLDHRYHGIGPAKARELAWEFGKMNKITRMPHSWETNHKAGVDWLRALWKEMNSLAASPRQHHWEDLLHSTRQQSLSSSITLQRSIADTVFNLRTSTT